MRSDSKQLSSSNKKNFLKRKRIKFHGENDVAGKNIIFIKEFDPNTPVKTIPKSPIKRDLSDYKSKGILNNSKGQINIKAKSTIKIIIGNNNTAKYTRNNTKINSNLRNFVIDSEHKTKSKKKVSIK
jgi:hypothetical protein